MRNTVKGTGVRVGGARWERKRLSRSAEPLCVLWKLTWLHVWDKPLNHSGLKVPSGEDRTRSATATEPAGCLPDSVACWLAPAGDAQAQRRSRKTGENESVTSIFLLFLEGEFVFHILKGVCDHIATKSFSPGITFPFSFLTKHSLGSPCLTGSSLCPDVPLRCRLDAKGTEVVTPPRMAAGGIAAPRVAGRPEPARG